jgi:hypothetical protein
MVDEPVVGVLDVDVIRRGLQHELLTSSFPTSLEAADRGAMHLFIESRTLDELMAKLPEFALQMGVRPTELEAILEAGLLQLTRVVDARGLDPDPRVVRVPEDDRPAAELASLLAPCFLMTDNYKHFNALGVTSHSAWLPAARGSLETASGDAQLGAMWGMGSLPFVMGFQAVQWADRRYPAARAALLATGAAMCAGAFVYLRSPTRRAKLAAGFWRVLPPVLELATQAMQKRTYGERLISEAVEITRAGHTCDRVLAGHLARLSAPATAAELWHRLEEDERRIVGSVDAARATLRSMPAFVQVRRGRWLVGAAQG